MKAFLSTCVDIGVPIYLEKSGPLQALTYKTGFVVVGVFQNKHNKGDERGFKSLGIFSR